MNIAGKTHGRYRWYGYFFVMYRWSKIFIL